MDRPPDRDATPFKDFYREHYPWVVHRAGRTVGARDAEDVAQEIFVRVALAHERGEFDLSTSARAYLRKATYTTARDHQRRLLREQPAAHDDEEIDPMDETLDADPERALAVRRRCAELDEVLETLRPERRIVWVMSEFDAMKLGEIAEVLNISPNTVNKRLQLARADIEAAVARKRAVEKRKLGSAGALLLLPLDAATIGRMARTLPIPDVPAATRDRLWRRIQEEVARRRLDGDAPPSPPSPEPPPRTLGPRLKSQARELAAITLGTVVGLLAALALADSHVAPSRTADSAREPVASGAGPAVVESPLVVDGVGAAPMGSTNTPTTPAGSSEPERKEARLVLMAEEALDPPHPNPEEALRLLDRHAELYPQSRRFADLVARLRRKARQLAEQKR